MGFRGTIHEPIIIEDDDEDEDEIQLILNPTVVGPSVYEQDALEDKDKGYFDDTTTTASPSRDRRGEAMTSGMAVDEHIDVDVDADSEIVEIDETEAEVQEIKYGDREEGKDIGWKMLKRMGYKPGESLGQQHDRGKMFNYYLVSLLIPLIFCFHLLSAISSGSGAVAYFHEAQGTASRHRM